MRPALSVGLAASIIATARGRSQSSPHTSPDTRDTPVKIPLNVFQIETPIRESYDGAACSQTIVQNDFTASYGTPYVGTYTPPPDCHFTTVVFNMTVTSAGINYDRLSLLYFGDIEVWRSTTAMPVRTGIYYTFSKDMTVYMPLLRTEQKVIMQLDNIYNSVFTGNYNITITALYYNDLGGTDTINPPDAILPISSKSSAQNTTSVYSLPDGNASVSLTFPRNVERAVVSVFASGNGNEEFWYTDVPAEFLMTFGNTSFANGYGPWREVQVLIDGNLAGFVWPEPVIFTGGISPGLWVPIVGLNTYDLGSTDVDISPWLGILCDGESHVFELQVAGYNSSSDTGLGTVAQNWYVSGEVFLWLDEGGNQTTGTALDSTLEDPVFKLRSGLTTSSNGTNSSLQISLYASRALTYWDLITTSKGTRNLTWSQNNSYQNTQNFTNNGRNETLFQGLWPAAMSSPAVDQWDDALNLNETVALEADYRLSFFQSYVPSSDFTAVNSTLDAVLDMGKEWSGQRTISHLTYPTSDDANMDTDHYPAIQVRQNGSCFYIWNNTYYEDAGAIDPAQGSLGATDEWFSGETFLSTPQGRVFKQFGRYASAVDGYEPVLEEDNASDGTIAVPSPEVVKGIGINEIWEPDIQTSWT